jgi:hypothetical protein
MQPHESGIERSIGKLLMQFDLPREVSLDNPKVLRLDKKKNHYSLVFVDKLLFQIIPTQSQYTLEFRPEYEPFFHHTEAPPSKWIELRLNDIDEIITLKDNIGEIFEYEIRSVHGDAFGCCSRYVECSDAKKCIHEDFLLSLCCQYRINLLNNGIFYGRNRNNY